MGSNIQGNENRRPYVEKMGKIKYASCTNMWKIICRISICLTKFGQKPFFLTKKQLTFLQTMV